MLSDRPKPAKTSDEFRLEEEVEGKACELDEWLRREQGDAGTGTEAETQAEVGGEKVKGFM